MLCCIGRKKKRFILKIFIIMQESKFELFFQSEVEESSLKNVTGGHYHVVCKDSNGEPVGSYDTDCNEPSSWLSDCKSTWPATAYCAGA
jgi:hypothetical protein